MPDELDKVPIPGGGTGVNQPETPYGDIATLDKLKKDLGPPGAAGPGGALPPPGGPGDPAAEGGAPLPPAGDPNGTPGESPLPGLPSGILNPTDQPGVPVGSPLGSSIGAAPGAAVDAVQRRLQVVTALQQSDNPRIREWANIVLELLIGGEDG
jgi:hypothetical protein